jgi:hypothetical protein
MATITSCVCFEAFMAPNADGIPWLAPYLQRWSTISFSTWPSSVLVGVVGNMLLSLIRKNQSPSKFNNLLLLCKYKFESGLRQEA